MLTTSKPGLQKQLDSLETTPETVGTSQDSFTESDEKSEPSSYEFKHLLDDKDLFSAIKMEQEETLDLITPRDTDKWAVMQTKLYHLRERRFEYVLKNPCNTYDVDEFVARQWFTVLLKLARIAQPGIKEQIHFLLSIPAIYALVVESAKPDQTNELLRRAQSVDNQDVVFMLLTIPMLFARAIEDNKYSIEHHTYLFMMQMMRQFHSEMRHVNRVNSLLISRHAELCIYFIKQLIHRNSDVGNQEIRFLLKQEQVGCLAHEQDNALLRFALQMGNQSAIALLICISAVYDVAKQHDFYPMEARGLLVPTYQLKIIYSGVEYYYEILYNEIVSRYKENPAKILMVSDVDTLSDMLADRSISEKPAEPMTQVSSRMMDLPLRWQELDACSFSERDKKSALISYYRNNTHTAYRYLRVLNQWRAVGHDVSFEPYCYMIILFYLAIKDMDKLFPTMIHHAFNCFIDELAYVGRLQNKITDTQGLQDDLCGDKPGCFDAEEERFLAIVRPLLRSFTLFAKEPSSQSDNYSFEQTLFL